MKKVEKDKGDDALRALAPLLTERETCMLVKLSKPYLRRLVKEGKFPAPVRPGGGRAIRYRRMEVLSWVERLA